ncbi:hypothetical protein ACFQX6_27940 [Streptosporangium lutulentum]
MERERLAGGFFSRFPRHRRLISLNKVHTLSDDPETQLRWDWNSLLSDDPSLLFPQYSDDYFPSPTTCAATSTTSTPLTTCASPSASGSTGWSRKGTGSGWRRPAGPNSGPSA